MYLFLNEWKWKKLAVLYEKIHSKCAYWVKRWIYMVNEWKWKVSIIHFLHDFIITPNKFTEPEPHKWYPANVCKAAENKIHTAQHRPEAATGRVVCCWGLRAGLGGAWEVPFSLFEWFLRSFWSFQLSTSSGSAEPDISTLSTAQQRLATHMYISPSLP